MKNFSACWSDALGQAIKEACIEPYTMELVGKDKQVVIKAVNQGIDSCLEACYISERGDSYVDHGKLHCTVSSESLPVLVRRLMESGDETAENLASSICYTLDIELI